VDTAGCGSDRYESISQGLSPRLGTAAKPHGSITVGIGGGYVHDFRPKPMTVPVAARHRPDPWPSSSTNDEA
jgi:hypothetical protein